MPDKDPQNYSLIQYAWVVGLSVWGGVVGYLQKMRQSASEFHLGAMVSEMITSSLAGILAFFICELAGVGGLMSAICIAIAGHTGGEFVSRVKGGVWSRYGATFDQSNSDKGDRP